MARLFPSPEELTRHIGNWVKYVDELEAEVAARDKRIAEVTAERDGTVGKVVSDLSQARTASSVRISELELAVAQLTEEKTRSAQQVEEIIQALCDLLEIKRTARTTVREIMILAGQLITESKRVVRENL